MSKAIILVRPEPVKPLSAPKAERTTVRFTISPDTAFESESSNEKEEKLDET